MCYIGISGPECCASLYMAAISPSPPLGSVLCTVCLPSVYHLIFHPWFSWAFCSALQLTYWYQNFFTLLLDAFWYFQIWHNIRARLFLWKLSLSIIFILHVSTSVVSVVSSSIDCLSLFTCYRWPWHLLISRIPVSSHLRHGSSVIPFHVLIYAGWSPTPVMNDKLALR